MTKEVVGSATGKKCLADIHEPISAGDPLELEEVLALFSMDFEYKQLSKGQFQATLNARETDGVVFLQESHSTQIMVSSGIPESRYFLIFDDLLEDAILANGIRAKQDNFFIYAPGAEFRVITSKPVIAPQLQIPKSLIDGKLRSRRQEDDWSIQSVNCLQIDPVSHALIRQEIKRAISFGQAYGNNIIDFIVERMIYAQAHEPESSLPKAGRPRKMNTALFYNTSDYIEANLDKGVSVESVCDYSCMSQRQLDRILITHTQLSIKKYITMCKLNAIRNNLLRKSRESTSVQAEARRYGIYHIGRLSQAYRQFFGEPPLKTLMR